MRGATEAAKRLRRVFSSLKSKLGKVPRLPQSDPVSQLILGVFTRNAPENKAREVLDALRAMVVDYNELRVIPPLELAEVIEGVPDAARKCEDVSRALNRIFAIEHSVSLDRLRDMSKKDARAYLDKIEGIEPYTRARIRLLGLEHHAIPLDSAMWAFSRENGIVDSKCTLEEAQSFLERQISEDDAPEFIALLKKQAWADFGTRVKRGDIPLVESVPPDRSSTNMLASMIAADPAHAPHIDEEIDAEFELDESGELTVRRAGRRSSRGKTERAESPRSKNRVRVPPNDGAAANKPSAKRAKPAAGGSSARARKSAKAKSA